MKFKIFLFNILLLFTLLFIGELGVRIFFPKKINYQRTYPGEYKNKDFDSLTTVVTWPKFSYKLGWVCNNQVKELKFSNPLYNNLNIKYSINNSGFRYHNGILSNTTKEIMILGDSFVFGVYLNDTSTIPYLIQNLLDNKYNVCNLGIPGWGLDQMYLSYLFYARSTGTQNIIIFFIDDDIYRVLEAYRFTEGMNKPSLKINNGYLELRMNDSRNVLEFLLQKSKLLNPIYKWYCETQAIKISKKIFLTLKVETLKKKQNFLVVHIPVIEQVLYPDKYENLIDNNYFNKNYINYLDIKENFKKINKQVVKGFYLKDDGHLTEKGAEIVAKIVINKLSKYDDK